jgi:sulfite exporter TauE/SafE
LDLQLGFRGDEDATMNSLGPATAFVMGLLGSAHCVAMCGGVVGVLCAGMPVQLRTRPVRQLPFTLAYNAGRLASYTMAGLLAGGVGALATDLAPIRFGQLALRCLAGALMVGVGLYLAGLWPSFARLEHLGAPVWKRVQPLVRRLLPVRSPVRAAAVGLLWGAMPCGLVYAALGLALGAGSASAGAMTMAAFGLGTLPMLLAMGVVASGVSRLSRRPVVRRGAGVLVGAFGVLSLALAIPQIGAAASPTTAGSHHVQCHCH